MSAALFCGIDRERGVCHEVARFTAFCGDGRGALPRETDRAREVSTTRGARFVFFFFV